MRTVRLRLIPLLQLSAVLLPSFLSNLTAAETETPSHTTPGSGPHQAHVLQPPPIQAWDPPYATSAVPASPLALPSDDVSYAFGQVTIDELVHLALCNNPAIAQAAARIEALRGRQVQAGLPPNPTVGYLASEVGNDGRGGQHGGFAGQEFVTAGKLRLDQAVVAQELHQAAQQLETTRLRVTNDVRQAAYGVLIAQRRVEVTEELEQLTAQAVQASQELVAAQELSRAGLLQTQVEQQTTALLAQAARNEHFSAWRRLSAVAGTEVPQQRIAEDITQLPALLNWEEQLSRITASSPELGAAMAGVVRAQAALARATVEPRPNLTTQASVQYDESTNYTIAGLQVGVPLPIWNRNQGNIRQSRAEIVEARRNAERVELDLKLRLSETFQRYATAHAQAESYATSILPKARETFELVRQAYRLGEVSYLDLLTAQRSYTQANLSYLDALGNLWTAFTEIKGLLLNGSLSAPPD